MTPLEWTLSGVLLFAALLYDAVVRRVNLYEKGWTRDEVNETWGQIIPLSGMTIIAVLGAVAFAKEVLP